MSNEVDGMSVCPRLDGGPFSEVHIKALGAVFSSTSLVGLKGKCHCKCHGRLRQT